jgi:hypothetical protein
MGTGFRLRLVMFQVPISNRGETIMYARRTILKGAAALPLAAILADPFLRQAVAAGLDDVTIKTENGRGRDRDSGAA